MIRVRLGELSEFPGAAVLRPVAADGSAATPAARRLELAAGAAPVEQCRRLGELPVGSATITGAGALLAEYMIHVVVRADEQPVTAEGVRRALVNGLRRLEEWGIESVVLPPLGTGAGNLDPEEAASIMVPLLAEHLLAGGWRLAVTVAVENEYEREAFERALGGFPDLAPPDPDPVLRPD